MDNLPPPPLPLLMPPQQPPSSSSQLPHNSVLVPQNPLHDLTKATPEQLISLLHDGNLREQVLVQLNKIIKQKRENWVDLALLVWNSFNTVYILLQLRVFRQPLDLSRLRQGLRTIYLPRLHFVGIHGEVIAVYSKFSASTLTMEESNRVCNALAVLQCMASHPDTRKGLVKANIPYYLYPFLKTSANEKPLEFVRLSSLGLIGSLAKFDDPYGRETLHFFLETQLFPLCLHCMDHGDELTRKVATLIVMKILMQEEGLEYCCALAERVVSVAQVLRRVVDKLSASPSLQLLKYVVQCYLSLSKVSLLGGVYDALRCHFPPQLFDNTFHLILREEPEILIMLQQIVVNITRRGYRP